MAGTFEIQEQVLLPLQDAFRYNVSSDIASIGLRQRQDLKFNSAMLRPEFYCYRKNAIGLAIVLIFLLTYTITLLKSRATLQSSKCGREPPMVPYWIPFLGILLPFIRDPFSYCEETMYVSCLFTRTSVGGLQCTVQLTRCKQEIRLFYTCPFKTWTPQDVSRFGRGSLYDAVQ